METNTIIKGLVKEFEMEGTREFLKNFNIATRRVENMSMFIGKYKNFTFMSNGKVLMGYMNRENAAAIQFTFKDLNDLPWTNIYEPNIKLFIKKVIDAYFKTNAKLVNRFQLIVEASNHYEEILLRALKGKVVNIKELKANTRIIILEKIKREGALASSFSASNEEIAATSIPTVTSEEKVITSHDTLNLMKLAHKIRIEEKLEGHYHAQMKYALQKAHQLIKGNQSQFENMSEDIKEAAIDESTSIKEELTLKEVLEKYKGQYSSYVYFDGFNITISIKGQTKTMPTKYKGIKLEKEFIPKLGIFKDKTLVIHHYDVFEPQENIDFVMIP